jgi:hypothetical protein
MAASSSRSAMEDGAPNRVSFKHMGDVFKKIAKLDKEKFELCKIAMDGLQAHRTTHPT